MPDQPYCSAEHPIRLRIWWAACDIFAWLGLWRLHCWALNNSHRHRCLGVGACCERDAREWPEVLR